jgi:hypothetical protein
LYLYSCPSLCPFLPTPHSSISAFNLSTSSLAYLFLIFPLSLSACSSCTLPSIWNLAIRCPLLAPISDILQSLQFLLFLPSPDLCPVHQHTLYHILKHHHYPPEITSPLSLSYSPHFAALSVSLVVAQVLELAHSFYLPPFLHSLALVPLSFSLVEHYHFRLLNIHFQFFLPHILFQAPHHFFHLSLSLFATITKSFANVRLHTFFLPTTTPSACAFLNISSTSATYIVNSRGLSGQLCLTVVSNHSPSFFSIFTLFLVLEYISSTFLFSHLLISLCLAHTPKHFFSVHLVKRLVALIIAYYDTSLIRNVL